MTNINYFETRKSSLIPNRTLDFIRKAKSAQIRLWPADSGCRVRGTFQAQYISFLLCEKTFVSLQIEKLEKSSIIPTFPRQQNET